MLRYLRVTNFAILSDVALEFGPGMTVLTGETGAGKSLIVEAVSLLRGARASADIPRTGADEATVEAIVDVPRDLCERVRAVLDAAGLPGSNDAPADDNAVEVSIRRIIQRGGRSRTYVNGALTTASRLAELGALLIDLSGQHQHQGLSDPRRHGEILDLFASCHVTPASGRGRRGKDATALPRGHEAPALLAKMNEAWRSLAQLNDEIAHLRTDDQARAARLDYLTFVIGEIDSAAPVADEDLALAQERARLGAVDQLQVATGAVDHHLYSADESALDHIGAAVRELDRLGRIDDELKQLCQPLFEAKAIVEDVAQRVRAYRDGLEADPERLARVDDRLALLRRLCRKYGGDLASVIARADEFRAELAQLDPSGARLAELEALRERAGQEANSIAASLSALRAAAAQALERDVQRHMSELGMASARLTVAITPKPLGPNGCDHIEFVLSSNPGEEPRPLSKVASGGELSRIMLATKLALRRADEVATYVFDEVDTGVGGSTATAVGAQIRAAAEQRQVLCVTHLPQIAAYADHHFEVAKEEVRGRTETHVTRLDGPGRKDALARLLGGQATPRARAHAAELLADARARTDAA